MYNLIYVEHELCSVVWQYKLLHVWAHNSVAYNCLKNKMAAPISVLQCSICMAILIT